MDRKCLEHLKERTGSPTLSDTIVQAIRVHDYFTSAREDGKKILVENRDGTISEVFIL
jgi:hypothetical protein